MITESIGVDYCYNNSIAIFVHDFSHIHCNLDVMKGRKRTRE